jgi:Predicted transcriptional regulators
VIFLNIGEHIKRARESKSLSMNQLAKISGAPQSALSQIEAGNRQPTFDMLDRIVTGLGLTLGEFFATEPPELSPELRKLLEAYETLSEEQKLAIRNMIELLGKG